MAVCTPGTTRCMNDGQETCDSAGQWGASEACALGCNGDACTKVAEMALGNSHSCALLTDGTVRCWGGSEYGQLGDGTIGAGTMRPKPGPVLNLTSVVHLASGPEHTCATLADGTAKCWGHNGFGKLGDGTFTSSPLPVNIAGITDVAGVTGGHSHTCAWLTNNSAMCWGLNQFGQLGTGNVSNSMTPVAVVDLTTAKAISAGGRHTCALLQDETVKCWGDGSTGQLGDGTSGAGVKKLTPSPVPGIANAAQIELSHYAGCTRSVAGSVSCWGSNSFGQVGDGTTVDQPNPTQVAGLADIQWLAGGVLHMCALDKDGVALCWGGGADGQLGAGVTPGSQPLPKAAMNKPGAVGIAAGDWHTCVWHSDANATVQCWGGNGTGQLGNGTTMGTSLPTTVVW